MERKFLYPALAALACAVLVAGCDDSGPGRQPAQATAHDGTPGNVAHGAGATSIALTDALLQGYARGLEKEAEIIRRKERDLPGHMRVEVSARYPTDESREVLAAAGLTAEEFVAVQRAVEPVLDLLSLQGKLEPKRSLDLERASEEQRRRLESDPFDALPAESANALRRNYGDVTRPWSRIVRQVAQFD